jgi:C4-dicarboxylate transporter, DctM subunit
MTLGIITMIASLILFFVLAVPVAFSIGISAILAIIVSGSVPLDVVPQKMINVLDSFPFLAVPFFILAGEIMMRGGISQRLIRFAASFFASIKGGLSYVSISASAFFGAISGSALATTAAIGSTMHPEMMKRGYKSDFASTIHAVGGTLGILIPPSIPLIIIGVLTPAGVGDLFIAVIGAGVLTAVGYMVTSAIIIKKQGMNTTEHENEKFSFGEVLSSFKGALWGLFTPVLILGGIYGGIFTPTEAAVIGCIYVLFVSLFVYKELKIKDLKDIFVKSAQSSVEIMIIISSASLLGYVMTIGRIPQAVSEAVLSIADGPGVFLLLSILIYFIAGMFLETATIILLLVPLLSPISIELGIDPVHFGVLTIVALAFGMITPPFGTSLFVSVGITKEPLENVFRSVLPFIVAAIIISVIVAFVPAITIGLL